MKKCLQCKRNLPLFMFHTNDSKYQREADKGKVIECRLCVLKRIKKDKGIMQRVDGKFTFVNVKYKYILKR